MRAIDEIKADLNKALEYTNFTNSQACKEIPADEYFSHYCGGVERFSDELRLALTDGVPLDRTEAIFTAERDGTLHIAPDITSIPAWLPCKVGDTMYSSTLGKVRSFIVAGFEFYGKKLFVVEQIKIGREMREYGKAAHRTQAEADATLALKEV